MDEQSSAQQCIFCQIVSGAVPAKKIYEDDKVVAILDINPASPGHILLLTRDHYAIMPQIPEQVIGHIGKVTKTLSRVLIKALSAQGTSTFIANGVAGGQRAQHFMLHVIPRMPDDKIPLDIPRNDITAADQDNVLRLIAPVIKNVLGYEIKNIKPVDEPEKEVEDTAVSESDDNNDSDNDTGEEQDDSTETDTGGLDDLTDFLTK